MTCIALGGKGSYLDVEVVPMRTDEADASVEFLFAKVAHARQQCLGEFVDGREWRGCDALRRVARGRRPRRGNLRSGGALGLGIARALGIARPVVGAVRRLEF